MLPLGRIDPETASAFVELGVSIFNAARNIFGERISAEEQAQKAGVWGAMLVELWSNPTMTSEQLGRRWVDNFPFAQSSTKTRTLENHFIGQSRSSVEDYLVMKINDELGKGGLSLVTKSKLRANFKSQNHVISNSDLLPQAIDNSNQDDWYLSNYSPENQHYSYYQDNQQASMGTIGVLMLIGVLVAGIVKVATGKKNGNNSPNLHRINKKNRFPRLSR